MSAKRTRKPLAALSSNIPAPKKQKIDLKKAPITQPPDTFTPLDYPAPEHLAKACIPHNTELSPIAFFKLFWDDSILDRIVEATNAYALTMHTACAGTLQHQCHSPTCNTV